MSGQLCDIMFLKVLIVILAFASSIQSIELTFELPDNTEQCFYEYIEQNMTSTIEFQVVSGGQHDVDVTVKGPNRRVFHREMRKQYKNFVFTPPTTGIYTLCFSNEFSTFSHKLVYMRFQVGPDEDVPGYLDHLNTLHSIESATEQLHQKMNEVTLQQTRYRLREAQGKKRAEDLNDRVMWWSLAESLLIILVVVGEVRALKNFFPDQKMFPNNTVI